MIGFSERVSYFADLTKKRLDEILSDKEQKGANRLTEAMRYSVLDGGKRLRAYMVCEFAELCGVSAEKVLNYAAAIEMIHAFSLIHDDLPSMDNDDMRRGKPSNHKAFGESTAILAGDALALDAFKVAGNNELCSLSQNALACVVLADKSGGFGMCAGQQCDLDGEGKQISLDELKKLVDLKTGALFSGACMLGCIGADADDKKIKAAV